MSCSKNGLKREGESCTLNNNCIYPKCMKKRWLLIDANWIDNAITEFSKGNKINEHPFWQGQLALLLVIKDKLVSPIDEIKKAFEIGYEWGYDKGYEDSPDERLGDTKEPLEEYLKSEGYE